MLKMGFKALLGEANAEITTISAEEATGYIGNDDIQFVDVRETQEIENSGGLPGHVHGRAELGQGLPVLAVEPVEKAPSRRISQRLEHLVVVSGFVCHDGNNTQANTCMSRAGICLPVNRRLDRLGGRAGSFGALPQ